MPLFCKPIGEPTHIATRSLVNDLSRLLDAHRLTVMAERDFLRILEFVANLSEVPEWLTTLKAYTLYKDDESPSSDSAATESPDSETSSTPR